MDKIRAKRIARDLKYYEEQKKLRGGSFPEPLTQAELDALFERLLDDPTLPGLPPGVACLRDMLGDNSTCCLYIGTTTSGCRKVAKRGGAYLECHDHFNRRSCPFLKRKGGKPVGAQYAFDVLGFRQILVRPPGTACLYTVLGAAALAVRTSGLRTLREGRAWPAMAASRA
jgi:hypothetical protein